MAELEKVVDGAGESERSAILDTCRDEIGQRLAPKK